MKKKVVCISFQSLLSILLFGISAVAYGQGETHNVSVGTGRLQLVVSSRLAYDQDRMRYPMEYNLYTPGSVDEDFVPRCAKGAGVIIAARNFQAKAYYRGPTEYATPDNWFIGDTLVEYPVVDATAWHRKDVQHTTVPVGGGAHVYWKQPPTIRVVAGENLSTSDWNDAWDVEGPADMPTDQMGEAICKTYMGITISQRAHVFDHDDFAIVEYVFKYTGNTGSYYDAGGEITYSDPIKDCYVGIKFRPILSNAAVTRDSEGWNEGTDDWVDYTYSEDGDTLRVLYGWDGDSDDDTYCRWDDEGDPLFTSSGIFTASQYPGMAVLHADKSTADHADDPVNQPHRFWVSWGGNKNVRMLGWHMTLTSEQIYNILDTGPDAPRPFDWAGWEAADFPYHDNNLWHWGTRYATEDNRFNQMGTLGFGPYDFNAVGDSIRIVLCLTAGTIDWNEAIDLGALFAEAAGDISGRDKNKILRSGRDSLFAKVKWVKELFEPNFQANSGDLYATLQDMSAELGAHPAWPNSVTLSPAVMGCRVDWVAPTEDADVVAYRVYRRSKIDFNLTEPTKEPGYYPVYQCGGVDPGGDVEYSSSIATTWTDTLVHPVFSYWYYVTSVNSDGLESSHFIGRTNSQEGLLTYGSVSPNERENVELDKVHVIPNPYHVKALGIYDWSENELRFIGLPANCRIRIFAQNGVLIHEDSHTSTGDVAGSNYTWAPMRSLSDQAIASGLYIYVIDQCRDFEGVEIDETKVGKFVVIR